MSEHPLRRRYGLELGLGILLAALTAWAVLGREPAERDEAARPAERAPLPALETQQVPLEPAAVEQRHELEPKSQSADSPVPDVDPRALDVLVQDSDGQPCAGLELELVATYREAGVQRDESLGRLVTRSDGHARFQRESVPFRAGILLHTLRCREPLVPRLVRELGADLPDATVVLVLPAHGRLEVRATRGGVPVRSPVRFEFFLDTGSEDLENPLVRDGAQGVAVFPALTPGLRGFLRAVCAESGSTEIVGVHGPRQAGELATATLELGPLWPRVALRVLDENGKPLARTRFTGWVDQGNATAPLPYPVTSDAHGRLEIHLPPLTAEAGASGLVLCVDVPLRPDEAAPRARLDLPERLDSERPTELGNLLIPFAPSQAASER